MIYFNYLFSFFFFSFFFFLFFVLFVSFFFFFQAEDGIRDIGVTGVQTCALPIYYVLIQRVVHPCYRTLLLYIARLQAKFSQALIVL